MTQLLIKRMRVLRWLKNKTNILSCTTIIATSIATIIVQCKNYIGTRGGVPKSSRWRHHRPQLFIESKQPGVLLKRGEDCARGGGALRGGRWRMKAPLAVPLAQARAGGKWRAGEVPLMTSHSVTSQRWRQATRYRQRASAGGLSNAPPARQRRRARPRHKSVASVSEWCARPHEDPAEWAGTIRRVLRPDPGAARRFTRPAQVCVRSAPACLRLRDTLHFCVYFRFRCVEPLGVRLLSGTVVKMANG